MPKTLKKIQSGFTIIELLIVIAIIGILAGLVLNNFQGAQAKARDVQRKTRMNSIYSKLEEYYNNNGGYPDGLLSTTVLPGMDAAALTDPNGVAITQTFSSAVAAPAAPTPTSALQMYYQAYNGCAGNVAQSPVTSTCTKYTLTAYQEKSATYVKTSLN